MDTTISTIINIAGKDFLFGVIFGMIIGYIVAKNHIFKEKQEIRTQYDKEIERILEDKKLMQERLDKELQRTFTDKLATEAKFERELKRHTVFHNYQLDRLCRNQMSDNSEKLFK